MTYQKFINGNTIVVAAQGQSQVLRYLQKATKEVPPTPPPSQNKPEKDAETGFFSFFNKKSAKPEQEQKPAPSAAADAPADTVGAFM